MLVSVRTSSDGWMAVGRRGVEGHMGEGLKFETKKGSRREGSLR